MKIIGLTGGIASGKSTASRYLEHCGIPIIDADLIAREVVQPGKPALKKIVDSFSEDILLPTGELNRKKLGQIVFSDPVKLKELNQIVHPSIRSAITQRIVHFEDDRSCKAVIIDAALLIETGLHEMVDDVWLMVVDKRVQLDRLISRNNLSEEDAQKMIVTQLTLEEKKKLARVYIDNNRGLADLYHQLDELVITIT
ncbi:MULTISPECIES: dephospho-CoA kinase [unclassified Fusibacter]|uniref:dephospho-CoA kinase n=1 Tax=unclassified Fusibacter TaxID=2624464 RepID=UPI001012F711|nr:MULTISPECIES: dephospho-CoA kinase [unclassified Fusibacter]MCK8060612.1 dephospho-CoA kinase [Fusibacter sp. A2]NPE22934.1 dephospho-CoA kinase [Fusibacter sp. A1]RXV60001.1 dephospho-CoA kinase [Fusibacter sp. A1]